MILIFDELFEAKRILKNKNLEYFKINDLAIKNKIEEMTQTRKITLLATNKVLCKSLTTTNKDIKKYHVNLASQDKQNPPDSAPLIRKPIIKQSNRRDYIKKGLKETLVKNKNDREEKRKLKLVRSTTFEIDLILDYWSKKGLFVHKEGTKSYAEAIDRIKSLLKGTLFNTLQDKSNHNRKFSMDEIKRAIDNYCLAAFNDDYEPMHKKFLQDIRLVDFFYTTVPVSKEEYKSTFLKYLLNKPTLIANSKLFSAKDLYPNATKIIIAWYKKTFGNRDEGKFTLKNRNDIVFATQALNKFYTDNKDKINIKNWTTVYNQTDPTSFLAVQMTRAMDKALRENENMFVSFTTAWLKSEKMFNERMPSFLHKEHMMR